MSGSESTHPIVLDDGWLADRSLSVRLERTWPVFFGQHGRLLPVQRAVIGPILDGESVLVCAATATGKTEAACAPLIERFIRRPEPWTVLYISPTRALVNDLYERLRSPVENLGLSISRRTGDYHDDLDPPPNVLLTTPESFDSLLCRGRKEEVGHVLAYVAAVVLDEIHLLHGTARGEQVRWLLERLKRLRAYAAREGWCNSTEVQIVGLSATLPEPRDVLAAYFPTGATLETVSGGRQIDRVGTSREFASAEQSVLEYVATLKDPEKILVFTNARRAVDNLASSLAPLLKPFGYRAIGHHGSLAQTQREDAERAVKTEKKIVLISTSTLEIGVDIGDIDLVVLDGPPPDVSSFLQRIGRGNRKTSHTRVMLCANNPADAVIQEAMLDAARASYLGPAEQGPHFAVARQQLASFIFQGRSRQRGAQILNDLLSSCLPGTIADALLEHLVSTADLIRDHSGIRLGAELLDTTVRGEIHCTIEGQPGYTVSDVNTGEDIATNIRYTGGKRLNIAGARLDVTSVTDRRIDVTRAVTAGAEQAKWSYSRSKFVRGASQPQAVRRALGLGENQWPVIFSQGDVIVFHFGGGRRRAFLKLLADRAGLKRSEIGIDDYTMRLTSGHPEKPHWMSNVGAGVLSATLADQLEKLENTLARPTANKYLPRELRLLEVEGWMNVAAQMAAIASSEWVIADDRSVLSSLQKLAGLYEETPASEPSMNELAGS